MMLITITNSKEWSQYYNIVELDLLMITDMKILNMIKNIGSFIFIHIDQYIHNDGHGFKYIIGSFYNIESSLSNI